MLSDVIGSLDVLNCCKGHVTVNFDKADAIETERARRMIQDMLKRGYALFVHRPDGGTVRVKRFDPKTDEYIVGTEALYGGDAGKERGDADSEADEAVTGETRAPGRRGRPKVPATRRVRMQEARTTGIAPTAGG